MFLGPVSVYSPGWILSQFIVIIIAKFCEKIAIKLFRYILCIVEAQEFKIM